MIDLTVDIPPFPKARPRVTRHGVYMPGNYQAARKSLAMAFSDIVFPDGCLSVTVWAYRKMPKSFGREKRQLLIGRPCVVGPDSDNILGGVLDSLFADDRRITTAICRKRWADRDYMRIIIDADVD